MNDVPDFSVYRFIYLLSDSVSDPVTIRLFLFFIYL